MRPENDEAKAEAEARKCEAEAGPRRKFFCEAEAKTYEAEAMHSV